jgi:hypothetical protein
LIETKEQDLFVFLTNEGLGVDDTAAWWIIRIVFWSILLFIAIRVAMAVIFAT